MAGNLSTYNKMLEKWNNQVNITNENVIVRVLEESFGPSKSSGNPMITLTWEVVEISNMRSKLTRRQKKVLSIGLN